MRRFIKEVAADLVKQMWTFVGLFSAWLVLTGSAKKVVGIAIVISIVLWIATFNLRQHEAQAVRRRIRAENEVRRRLIRRKKSGPLAQNDASTVEEELAQELALEEEIAIEMGLEDENSLDRDK
ncbi:MAG: hypothetical protein JW384_01635 [Nitrosomonadaceae bacterium]|jgi:hypothetical protein|nr:hypothetical protein [Nitrosomonadaceae bacterium]